jgi:O-antigen ligase
VSEKRDYGRPGIAESVVAADAIVFLCGVSWAFGGNADWVRTPISIWGSLGVLTTAWLVVRGGRSSRSRAISWSWPILALNILVMASCLKPGFRVLKFGADSYLLPVAIPWWQPSAARPDIAIRALWLFDGIYFSCLNIALAIRRRTTLRLILSCIAGNGLLLAAFGTVQKLVNSTGIYFGAIKSPQDYFFASFVYDNHWGAFMVLTVSTCVGLTLRYCLREGAGGLFRGPAPMGFVATMAMAITVPLSGARACTVLVGIVLAVGLAKGIRPIVAGARASGISGGAACIALAVLAFLSAWGAWTLGRDTISGRLVKTREQVAAAWEQGGLGARSVLYHDTWRMAKARPLFGWGMGSYPSVFQLYNTQEPHGDKIPVVYHDAHSDWLQSLSEVGFAGTSLIGIAAMLPIFQLFGKSRSLIVTFLMLGCTLVAAYAWIEFPFGNVAVVLGWWLCLFCAVQYAAPLESSDRA